MPQITVLNSRTISLLVATLVFLPCAAETYKWTDAEGNVIYSQSPPPGDIKAETIKPPPKVDTEGAVEQMQMDEKKAADLREGRLKEADVKKKAEADLALQEENCRRAQANLANYQRTGGLRVQPDGSRTRITEEERQKSLAEAEALIKEWCK